MLCFLVCIFTSILFLILLLSIVPHILLLQRIWLLRGNISPSMCRMEVNSDYRDILVFSRDRKSHLQNENGCVILGSIFSAGSWIQSISMHLLSIQERTVPAKLICKVVVISENSNKSKERWLVSQKHLSPNGLSWMLLKQVEQVQRENLPMRWWVYYY